MKPPSLEEAAALALVPLTLTADESQLLQRYRATPPYWRADIIDYANMVAKMFRLNGNLPRLTALSWWLVRSLCRLSRRPAATYDHPRRVSPHSH